MKIRIYLFVILCSMKAIVVAQTNKLIYGIDTTKLVLLEKENSKDYGVTELLNFKGDSAFIFYNHRQFVELLYDKVNPSGRIISFAKDYFPKQYDKEKKTEKIYIRETRLDSLSIVKLQSLIEESKILSIPTGDSIKNWKMGFDGITYQIEYTNKEIYTYKSYWTPNVQDSTLIEANKVEKFVSDISQMLNLEEEFNLFTTKLPFGKYQIGVMTILERYRTNSIKYRVKRFWRRVVYK